MKTGLIVHSTHPYNAEPPLDRLRAGPITPSADFYVRTHGDIPQLDPAQHRLHVHGQVATPLALSAAELQARFPHATTTAVLQCAGNRRADLQRVRRTSGDLWAPGAIGCARWTGAALSAVLQAAGADTTAGLHVAFDAADVVDVPGEGRFTYGVSIPIAKAADVLLAWSMNDEPLTPEHGFPLRAIVPGFAGVRSAKWLTHITVQTTPSANHMQQRDYKMLPPDITEAPLDWSRGVTIEELPLNAAICEPAGFARLPSGPTRIRGYAIASARAIARVDVSADGGRTWCQAALDHDPTLPWAWTFWHTTLDLCRGEHELAVRAWDAAGQTQPAQPDDTWNIKGYLSAAWHRIAVRAE